MDPAPPTNGSDWSDVEAAALHTRLLELGAGVAAAESLTVGRVQTALGRPSGASAYFAGGLTCYTIEAKSRLLGVDAAHATEVNAVSRRVAEEMARGVCRLFGVTFGVATTGYAEPDLSRGIAEPFAWVAVARGGAADGGIRTARVVGAGLDRSAMQARAATAALRLLAEETEGS